MDLNIEAWAIVCTVVAHPELLQQCAVAAGRRRYRDRRDAESACRSA
jgi:hypothetical protein